MANVIQGKVHRIRRSFFSKTTFSSSPVPASEESATSSTPAKDSALGPVEAQRKFSSSNIDRKAIMLELGSMMGTTSTLYNSILSKIHQDATVILLI